MLVVSQLDLCSGHGLRRFLKAIFGKDTAVARPKAYLQETVWGWFLKMVSRRCSEAGDLDSVLYWWVKDEDHQG